MLCIFLKILLFLWFRCPFVIFNLPIWKRFCTVARICNTQINISAHKQMFQNTSQNIISLKSISIHHRELFNTQQSLRWTFEMTQQNVIRYTTKNCMRELQGLRRVYLDLIILTRLPLTTHEARHEVSWLECELVPAYILRFDFIVERMFCCFCGNSLEARFVNCPTWWCEYQ